LDDEETMTMGVHANIGFDRFPEQGKHAMQRVEVCFDYDLSRTAFGTVVRDDAADPWRTIIRLDDGRHVLATECQYAAVRR
jgi:hypothetical protein